MTIYRRGQAELALPGMAASHEKVRIDNMNLTLKQIKRIIEHTPEHLKGKFVSIHTVLGIFVPAGANWGYRAGWTADGELVVTVFGQVK